MGNSMQTHSRRWLPVLILLITFVSGAYLGFKFWQSSPPVINAAQAVFKITNGDSFSVADFRGQPLLVNFWQSHCRPCMEEIPLFADLYRELSPRGFRVIGVVMYYDRPDQALAVAKRMQIPYPIAIDIDAKVATAFGNVKPTPTTFLIAPDGQVVFQRTGLVPIKKLRNRILGMLPEPEA